MIVRSNVGTITLNATLPESRTCTVTSGATVNFTLLAQNAVNVAATSSIIRLIWSLGKGRTRVAAWAWVSNGAAALTDGSGNNIPSSAVSVSATGSGSAGGALNSVSSGGAGVPAFITPAAATGVQIANIAITAANFSSSANTTLTWNIDTTVTPQLPAGTYTGTVNIQAQATP